MTDEAKLPPGERPEDMDPKLIRTFVRHIVAIEVGDGDNQLNLENEELVGGFLMWHDKDEEWMWVPRDIFLENYEEVN